MPPDRRQGGPWVITPQSRLAQADALDSITAGLSLTDASDDALTVIASLPERIASRITIDPDSGCWRCDLNRDKDGYARYGGEGVHRIVYRLLVGPIPEGMQIDHVRLRGCAWTDCCNPAHLEPVTALVNWERGNSPTRINALKTSCDNGHEFTPDNTYWRPNGHRDCRACGRVRVAKYKRRLARRRPYVQQLAA